MDIYRRIHDMKIRSNWSIATAIKPRPIAQRASVVALFIVALMLMIGHHSSAEWVLNVRGAMRSSVMPLITMLSQPANALKDVGYKVQEVKQIYAENHALKKENEGLLKWQTIAHQLERDNAELRSLLGLPAPAGVTHINASIVSMTHDPHHHTALVRHNGDRRIAKGQAVIAAQGLVGYVLDSYDDAAQILLVTDRQSRIPVEHEQNGHRAIMAGTHLENGLMLLHHEDAAQFSPGDRLITRRGMPFAQRVVSGIVTEVNGEHVLAKPMVNMDDLRFVSIVLPQDHQPDAQ